MTAGNHKHEKLKNTLPIFIQNSILLQWAMEDTNTDLYLSSSLSSSDKELEFLTVVLQ